MGYVEVTRRDINKGLAIQRVLQTISSQAGQAIDFVLCIGDDRSDEDMFEAVNNFGDAVDVDSPLSEILSPARRRGQPSTSLPPGDRRSSHGNELIDARVQISPR